MARSLAVAPAQPEGAFEHSFSHTRFTIRNGEGGVVQTWTRDGQSASLTFQYIVGAGEHASGYLAQVGDHLFQSPLSFYSKRGQWDVAPGYEEDPSPDFTRPVTAECLACHSGAPRPVPGTLNSYLTPPFAALGITCERCHGNTESHLKNPLPGTILNPSKLPEAARDSICEQCHLTGEVRIPNPGRSIPDFRPGETLEQSYTVYVAARPQQEDTVKVVSQAEQLALSVCKRNSGAKLWCATCHDPHQQPAQPVEYFRQRCLTCHVRTLAPDHASQTNCIGCHMPQRPAKDGGHTAFTDHRISRHPDRPQPLPLATELAAWRAPAPGLQNRNFALALVTVGVQDHDSAQVVRGYRMLNRLPKIQDDPAVLTALGGILLTAKEPAEAVRRFQEALALRPDYAPYEVNLAGALLAANDRTQGIAHLERALKLDPLLDKAVWLLAGAYRSAGDEAKAAGLVARYRSAIKISVTNRGSN